MFVSRKARKQKHNLMSTHVKVYAKKVVAPQAGAATKVARVEITGAIGWWKNTGEYFTEQVNELLGQGITDVEVYINTPGGNLFDANEIVNQLNRFSGKKSCELGAMCASAGTVIACEIGNVTAAKNLNYMIHNPILTVELDSEEDFTSNLRLFQNCKNQAIESYSKKTGLAKETVESMMKATTWMNAQEALANKFIDAIATEEDSLPEDTQEVVAKMQYKGVPQILNQSIKKPIKNKMEKLALKLGLVATATEDEILAELDRRELAQVQNTQEGITLIAAIGEKKGFKKETIVALAKGDFKSTVSLVMEAPEPIIAPDTAAATQTAPDSGRLSEVVASFKEMLGKNPATPEVKMSFSERLEKDRAGLKALLHSKPAEVKALFKEEYNHEPNLEELNAII